MIPSLNEFQELAHLAVWIGFLFTTMAGQVSFVKTISKSSSQVVPSLDFSQKPVMTLLRIVPVKRCEKPGEDRHIC